MKKIAASLIVFLLLTGCAMLQPSQTVVLSPQRPEPTHDSFAILPFADTRSAEGDIFGFSVTDAVTDSFQTAFLKSGYTIVERDLIEKALQEMAFSYMGHLDEAQRKEIGTLTSANVIILGNVHDFEKATYERVKGKMKTVSCTTLNYSVKAIHVETGEILWKSAITRSSGMKGDMFAPCDCNGVRFAERTSKTLVAQILAKTNSPLKKAGGEYDMFPSLGDK
jgi:hypothetical protein